MIHQTEHLVLDYKQTYDVFGQLCTCSKTTFVIKIKNVDNTLTDVLYIFPTKFDTCYLRTNGTMLQTCITTWDLYKELIQLVDEAQHRIELNKLTETITSD